jgi:hypothetical protein
MKIVKGFAILCLFTILFGSCFDPPEFPVVPQIEFERVEFIEPDSLILYIKFKDGDGDLGLDNANLDYISNPYHNTFFYQENNGKIDSLVTYTVAISNEEQYHVLDIPNPEKGKLVFPRTRKKPGYGYLPNPEVNLCVNYEYVNLNNRKIIIAKENLGVLDDLSLDNLDTLPKKEAAALHRFSKSGEFFILQDTLYYTPNPNHYNIDVDFFQDFGAGFEEYDWRVIFCQPFDDGRFPVLSENSSAVEGTLKYALITKGYNNIFGVRPLKLRIQIRDRALHNSNIIETQPFTLDRI